MFGRNKSTRESAKDCTSYKTSNVEAGSEAHKKQTGKKAQNKKSYGKNSRG